MSEREQRIRIAVVDDHEMFRAGVIATLQPHFDVVGQAADVEGSVAMIAQTKPDVVLLDVPNISIFLKFMEMKSLISFTNSSPR